MDPDAASATDETPHWKTRNRTLAAIGRRQAAIQIANEAGKPLMIDRGGVDSRLALVAGGVYESWADVLYDWYFWGNVLNVIGCAGYVVINFGRAYLAEHVVSLDGLYIAIALINLLSAVFYLFSWTGSFPHPDAVTVSAEYLNILAASGFVASSCMYFVETNEMLIRAVLLTEGAMCIVYLADSLLYAHAWYSGVPPGLRSRGCTLRDPELLANVLNVIPSLLYCVGSATVIWLHVTLPARRSDSATLTEALRAMARVNVWADLLFTADAWMYVWAWARDLRAEVSPELLSRASSFSSAGHAAAANDSSMKMTLEEQSSATSKSEASSSSFKATSARASTHSSSSSVSAVSHPALLTPVFTARSAASANDDGFSSASSSASSSATWSPYSTARYSARTVATVSTGITTASAAPVDDPLSGGLYASPLLLAGRTPADFALPPPLGTSATTAAVAASMRPAAGLAATATATSSSLRLPPSLSGMPKDSSELVQNEEEGGDVWDQQGGADAVLISAVPRAGERSAARHKHAADDVDDDDGGGSVCTAEIETSSLAGEALRDFLASAEDAAERGEDVQGYDVLMPCRRAGVSLGHMLSHGMFALARWCWRIRHRGARRSSPSGGGPDEAPYRLFVESGANAYGQGGGLAYSAPPAPSPVASAAAPLTSNAVCSEGHPSELRPELRHSGNAEIGVVVPQLLRALGWAPSIVGGVRQ